MYGLLIAESVGPKRILLRVEADDGEKEFEFTESEQVQEITWLHKNRENLPMKGPLAADQLATFGAHCAHCPLRPVCATYRKEAVLTWGGQSKPGGLPLDTWGTVEGVVPLSGALQRLDIRDELGRSVKIFGATKRLGPPSLSIGSRVSLFNLRSFPYTGTGGVVPHPVNFFEVASDKPKNSAFNASSYRDDF